MRSQERRENTESFFCGHAQAVTWPRVGRLRDVFLQTGETPGQDRKRRKPCLSPCWDGCSSILGGCCTREHPDIPSPSLSTNLGVSTSTKSRAHQHSYIPSGFNYSFTQARLFFFLSSSPTKETLACVDGAGGGSQPQTLPPRHRLCRRVPSPSTATSARHQSLSLAEHFVQTDPCSKLQTVFTRGNKGAVQPVFANQSSRQPHATSAAGCHPTSRLCFGLSSLNTYPRGLLFK